MTWSGHLAIGGLTLTLTQRPEILIPLNFGLHYVLDAIPHAEWHTFATERQNKPAAIAITVADVIVSIGMIWWFALIFGTSLAVIVALASLLPDIIRPLLEKWYRLPIIHQWWICDAYTHTWPVPPTYPLSEMDWSNTITLKTPLGLKLIYQALVLLIPIYIIFVSK